MLPCGFVESFPTTIHVSLLYTTLHKQAGSYRLTKLSLPVPHHFRVLVPLICRSFPHARANDNQQSRFERRVATNAREANEGERWREEFAPVTLTDYDSALGDGGEKVR